MWPLIEFKNNGVLLLHLYHPDTGNYTYPGNYIKNGNSLTFIDTSSYNTTPFQETTLNIQELNQNSLIINYLSDTTIVIDNSNPNNIISQDILQSNTFWFVR